jgi:hypothetical protein
LFETRGICPPARDIHGLLDRHDLPDHELRRAVASERSHGPSILELIRGESPDDPDPGARRVVPESVRPEPQAPQAAKQLPPPTPDFFMDKSKKNKEQDQ